MKPNDQILVVSRGIPCARFQGIPILLVLVLAEHIDCVRRKLEARASGDSVAATANALTLNGRLQIVSSGRWHKTSVGSKNFSTSSQGHEVASVSVSQCWSPILQVESFCKASRSCSISDRRDKCQWLIAFMEVVPNCISLSELAQAPQFHAHLAAAGLSTSLEPQTML